MRGLSIVIALSLATLPAIARAAERVVVDPPMKLVAFRTDRSEVAGQVTGYDADAFDLTTAKGEKLTIRWDELPAPTALQVHERLWTNQATGEQWMGLGERLLAMPNGRAPADRAFAKAVRLDPSLKERVDEAKRSATRPAGGAPQAKGTPDAAPVAEVPPVDRRPVRDRGGNRDERRGDDGGGPRTVGRADPKQWGPLTDAEHAAAIEQLHRVAEQAKQEVTPKLTLYETQFFLFYSDLRRSEAEKWAGLLDRMYARLAELFAVPAGQNLWRGKALVFVFNRQEDFLTYERVIQDVDATEYAGLCHQYGDGQVRIAFYRQPHDLTFAHVLVHESVHGFLHRYRSPVHVPRWANEGLAEVIASELVENRAQRQSHEQRAREYLRSNNGPGTGFFSGRRLAAEQYSVAMTLCEFMIRQNKPGYVAFVNAVKDGTPWERAMAEHYGAPIDRVLGAYGDAMGVRGITRGGGGGGDEGREGGDERRD